MVLTRTFIEHQKIWKVSLKVFTTSSPKDIYLTSPRSNINRRSLYPTYNMVHGVSIWNERTCQPDCKPASFLPFLSPRLASTIEIPDICDAKAHVLLSFVYSSPAYITTILILIPLLRRKALPYSSNLFVA